MGGPTLKIRSVPALVQVTNSHNDSVQCNHDGVYHRLE